MTKATRQPENTPKISANLTFGTEIKDNVKKNVDTYVRAKFYSLQMM